MVTALLGGKPAASFDERARRVPYERLIAQLGTLPDVPRRGGSLFGPRPSRRPFAVQQAIMVFGAHLEVPGELEITAQAAAAGEPVLLVARRELAQAPIWVQHRPATASPAPSWSLSLDAGDYLLTIGVGHATGPVRIAFTHPAIVVSIPPPPDRWSPEVVAFECLATVTGDAGDPWPVPPSAPPRELPPVSRAWFRAQLLPLAG